MEWINNWIENRNNDEYKTIIVTNKFRFPEIAEQTQHLDDVAYISISATEDCVKGFFLGDEKEMEHYLPDANNVLNLNFDDITEDFDQELPNGEIVTYKTITSGQAEQVIDFVENNIDKHLIIHCRAGKSRSIGVATAIACCYGDVYKNFPKEQTFTNTPNDTPNIEVVSKIKRAFFKKHNLF
jgi:predicted protein tyrosine phosphatase